MLEDTSYQMMESLPIELGCDYDDPDILVAEGVHNTYYNVQLTTLIISL